MTTQAGKDAKQRFMNNLIKQLDVKKQMYETAFSKLHSRYGNRRNKDRNNEHEAITAGLAKVRELLQIAKLPRGNTFEAELTTAITKRLKRKHTKENVHGDYLAKRASDPPHIRTNNMKTMFTNKLSELKVKVILNKNIELTYSHKLAPNWYSNVYQQGIALANHHETTNYFIENAIKIPLTETAKTCGVTQAWTVVTHLKTMAVVVTNSKKALSMSFLTEQNEALSEAALRLCNHKEIQPDSTTKAPF